MLVVVQKQVRSNLSLNPQYFPSVLKPKLILVLSSLTQSFSQGGGDVDLAKTQNASELSIFTSPLDVPPSVGLFARSIGLSV